MYVKPPFSEYITYTDDRGGTKKRLGGAINSDYALLFG